jgi:hypothetical protein
MARFFLTLFLSMICPIPLLLAQSPAVYVTDKGSVSFVSDAPIENIEARHEGPQSILNLARNEITFILPVRGFRFEQELMEEHFNEKYLESDRFPNATFTGVFDQSLRLVRDTVLSLEARGTLTIHGVEKQVVIPGKAEVQNGAVRMTASFLVAVQEFGISIPKLLTENIADTVRVDLDILYKPFRKND